MADHTRVNINTCQMSCGVLELSRISAESDEVLYAIASRLYHPARGQPAAVLVFSDVVSEETSSSTLVKAIYENGLGSVVTSTPTENPKTANIIVVYVWTVVHDKFKAWYSERRVDKLRRVGA